MNDFFFAADVKYPQQWADSTAVKSGIDTNNRLSYTVHAIVSVNFMYNSRAELSSRPGSSSTPVHISNMATYRPSVLIPLGNIFSFHSLILSELIIRL